MSFPDSSFSKIKPFLGESDFIEDEIGQQVEKEAKYFNYLKRQARDAELLQKDEDTRFPDDFNFETLSGLSNELTAKLVNVRPTSLAQASRIEGMTPAALTLLLAKIRQSEKRRA